jgi:hypothetical protein
MAEAALSLCRRVVGKLQRAYALAKLLYASRTYMFSRQTSNVPVYIGQKTKECQKK